jgi:putative SOS response-associated peptidase YedK
MLGSRVSLDRSAEWIEWITNNAQRLGAGLKRPPWVRTDKTRNEHNESAFACEPNELVAEVHDRMPVLLQPAQFDHWLSGAMGVAELKPAPNDYLQRWPVSKRVNSSNADKDDATLIEPIELAA